MSDRREHNADRYFFVHVMKTGGTALVQGLRNHFGDAVIRRPIWTGPTCGSCISYSIAFAHSSRSVAMDSAGRRPFPALHKRAARRKVHGYHAAPRTGRPRALVPVDEMEPLEEAHDELMSRTLPAMKWHPALDPTNNMTRMLSMTPEEMRRSSATRIPMTRDHLARAKAALPGMNAVGVQERFEDFCRELTIRFGWSLGDPARVNVPPSIEASDSLRARIAEDNTLDIELYSFARDLIRSE